MSTLEQNTAPKTIKKREDYWDLIRGICIFFVFIGHAIGGWNFITHEVMVPVNSFLFNHWIFQRGLINVCVPVFVFISGYMISEKSFGSTLSFYKKRILRFVIPFVIWTTVYSLIEHFVYGHEVTWVSVLLGTNAVQLYYLIVMLQLTLLTPLFFIAKNKKLVLILSILINVINNACHVFYIFTTGNKFANDTILATCFVSYYVFGLYLRNVKHESVVQRVELSKVIALFIAGYLGVLCNAYTILRITMNPRVGVTIVKISSLIFAFVTFALIMNVRGRIGEWDGQKNIFTRGLCWVGRHSMDFFLFHWVVENYVKIWFIKNVAPEYMVWSNCAVIGVTTAACVVYSVVADLLRKKLKRV